MDARSQSRIQLLERTRAHARQMGADDRKGWRRPPAQRPQDAIQAPNWLWDSVVDLIARHEAGYLEGCRRYALEDAA
jgi:uncharacterized protein (DUF2252 family)